MAAPQSVTAERLYYLFAAKLETIRPFFKNGGLAPSRRTRLWEKWPTARCLSPFLSMVQTEATTPGPNSVGNALRGVPADPERHGVRSPQDNRRIVTRNVGELDHAHSRNSRVGFNPRNVYRSPTGLHRVATPQPSLRNKSPVILLATLCGDKLRLCGADLHHRGVRPSVSLRRAALHARDRSRHLPSFRPAEALLGKLERRPDQ